MSNEIGNFTRRMMTMPPDETSKDSDIQPGPRWSPSPGRQSCAMWTKVKGD